MQAVWCVHYWHCVFIRCVGGYSLYVLLQLLGLFIIARGLGWVFWGLGGGVQVGWGGGGGKFLSFFSLLNFFFKNVPGVLKRMQTKIYFSGGGDFGVFGAPHAPTRGSRGVGKRYTSSYDHDMWPVKILERSGLAVKSYHPETLAAEEKKKKKKKKKLWQTHKAFPAGSRECLINKIIFIRTKIPSKCIIVAPE